MGLRRSGNRYAARVLFASALLGLCQAAACARYEADEGYLGILLLGNSAQFLSEAGPAAGWSRRRQITIDNSTRAETFTDFPVLVTLTAANFDYGLVQSAGQDIRFYDSDGVTLLDYEIEQWTNGGTSQVWVRVPQIDGSSNADFFYIYYGDANVTDGQNANATWDTSFASVRHFSTNAGQPLQDSTGTGADATDYGTTATSGPIGTGRYFAALSAQYLTIPTTAFDKTRGTLEAWVYPVTSDPTPGGARYVVSHAYNNPGTNTRIYMLMANQTHTTDNFFAFGDQIVDTGLNLSLGSFQYLVIVWNAGACNAYLNGAPVYGGAYSTAGFAANPLDTHLTVGRHHFNPQYWDGAIDELRVSNAPRSADWINAQYANMTASWLTYGAAETL